MNIPQPSLPPGISPDYCIFPVTTIQDMEEVAGLIYQLYLRELLIDENPERRYPTREAAARMHGALVLAGREGQHPPNQAIILIRRRSAEILAKTAHLPACEVFPVAVQRIARETEDPYIIQACCNAKIVEPRFATKSWEELMLKIGAVMQLAGDAPVIFEDHPAHCQAFTSIIGAKVVTQTPKNHPLFTRQKAQLALVDSAKFRGSRADRTFRTILQREGCREKMKSSLDALSWETAAQSWGVLQQIGAVH